MLAQTDHIFTWAKDLGALAGTLFLFVVALALVLYRIASWYLTKIAEPESRKRIDLIDQLATSVATITASIKSIVDNTTTVAVAIGRMEEKIEENHRGTLRHVAIAEKWEEVRPNILTKHDFENFMRTYGINCKNGT